MPSTTHGYPYGASTDPVAAVWQQIKDLADAVEAKVKSVQSGSDSITTIVGTVSKVINFPVAFPSAPKVTVCPIVSPASAVQMSIAAPTTTQVTVFMTRSAGTGPISFNWVAHG